MIEAMPVSILEREMYSEADAARLLNVAQGTLHYWLEGRNYRGKTYKPIIRPEARGSRTVTWAEFIEAGLLRQYRRELSVPMPELRTFIDGLREHLGIPYPLAHQRPFVADRKLVYELQEDAGLAPELCLVATAGGQLILTPASDAFFNRVAWDGELPRGWRPHADPQSPVRMTPDLRFGRPEVGGVSTEVLWEHAKDGEADEEIAEGFGLSEEDVRWALTYEQSQQSQQSQRAA